MPTITIEIDVNTTQQAKIKAAAEHATGQSNLTNQQVLALLKRTTVKHLRLWVKSELAEERRTAIDDSDIDDIPEV